MIVDRWYKEKIFLIGDASHQYPPSGGYGLNSGVSDAFSLAWRLKYIIELKNELQERSLKESFESERIIHSNV